MAKTSKQQPRNLTRGGPKTEFNPDDYVKPNLPREEIVEIKVQLL